MKGVEWERGLGRELNPGRRIFRPIDAHTDQNHREGSPHNSPPTYAYVLNSCVNHHLTLGDLSGLAGQCARVLGLSGASGDLRDLQRTQLLFAITIQ